MLGAKKRTAKKRTNEISFYYNYIQCIWFTVRHQGCIFMRFAWGALLFMDTYGIDRVRRTC